MVHEQQYNRPMRAVTISREYGSGGGEIAARLAQRLGWRLIDHELIRQVARLLGESEVEVSRQDEHVEPFIVRLLEGARWLSPWTATAQSVSLEDEGARYHQTVSQVIETAYRTGEVVIVGRSSQVLLGPHRDVLHLRVVAPLEQRVSYVARREGRTPGDARKRIEQKDADRAHYLTEYYHQRPDDVHLYDLVINTGVLSLDDAVDLSLLALQRKGDRLAVPAGKLGPVSGLAPYPGRPGDLMPSENGDGSK